MNGKQLKNSILQWAIQGKLVPQDPNDEPASVLLEKIRAEKARLVKEGKLKKKDLEVKPISEDEIPFEIPKGWEWVRISDLGDIITGGTPSKENQEYYGDEYPFYKPGDLDKGVDIFETIDGLSQKGFNASRKLKANSILVTCIGATIGKTGLIIKEGACNQQINAIIPYGGLCPKYIYYTICSPMLQMVIRKDAGQTTLPIMNKNSFCKLVFPLPPLAEQHRIVAKIEELMPLVEKYGTAQDALDKWNDALPEKLKKSILQEAIQGKLVPQDSTDEPASALLERIREEKQRLVKESKLKKSALKEEPITEEELLFEIPDTWKWCKLGWIGNWGSGATPAKGNPEFYDNGTIPWLRTGELNNGYVYDSEIKVTEKALEKCSLRMCQKGDVLIAMYGATIGKVAIAGIELTTNQACCACTPYLVYNKYLLYYLLASKKTFIELGEGGAQPNISKEKIVAFPFPLPPLAEQRRIVAKIEELFGVIK